MTERSSRPSPDCAGSLPRKTPQGPSACLILRLIFWGSGFSGKLGTGHAGGGSRAVTCVTECCHCGGRITRSRFARVARAWASVAINLSGCLTGFREPFPAGGTGARPLSVSTSGRSIRIGSAAMAASTVASSACGQAALRGIGAAQAQALLRRDAGVPVKLGELVGAGRGFEVFDHFDVNARRFLQDRQRLARGAALGLCQIVAFIRCSP